VAEEVLAGAGAGAAAAAAAGAFLEPLRALIPMQEGHTRKHVLHPGAVSKRMTAAANTHSQRATDAVCILLDECAWPHSQSHR